MMQDANEQDAAQDDKMQTHKHTNVQILSEVQLKACKDCFDFFDKDGNKKIDKNEIATAMRAVGLNPTQPELDQIMMHLEADENGYIGYEEFKRLVAKSWKSSEQSQIEMVLSFRVFDRNKDGYITVDELVHMFTMLGERMSPEEAEHFVKIADVDKDGKINYNDFVHVMCG